MRDCRLPIAHCQVNCRLTIVDCRLNQLHMPLERQGAVSPGSRIPHFAFRIHSAFFIQNFAFSIQHS